jgi:hypothetical protein
MAYNFARAFIGWSYRAAHAIRYIKLSRVIRDCWLEDRRVYCSKRHGDVVDDGVRHVTRKWSEMVDNCVRGIYIVENLVVDKIAYFS